MSLVLFRTASTASQALTSHHRFSNSAESQPKTSGPASSVSRTPKPSVSHATPQPQAQSSAPNSPSSPPQAINSWPLFSRSTPPIAPLPPKCWNTHISRKLQSPNQQPCSPPSRPRQGKKRDGDWSAPTHRCEAMRLRSMVQGRIFEGYYSRDRVWRRVERGFS